MSSSGTNNTQPAQNPEPVSSNKRIAKNALMLYLRMFLSMIVGLYTSRVVLDVLGVEDYGIYGVVGSVVSIMGFLNAAMSGATSRFIIYELGRGDKKRLSDTFSSAMIVHIGIALVVFVVAETVGLWFLMNKLVIPPERMTAAHWVYQMSIIGAMIGITQAPYGATMIAHEKMGVYAYVEILNVTLKLVIVYLLVIARFDKLIFYGALMLAVGVLIRMIYRIYCVRKFPETRFHWIWKPAVLKPLLSFSGWNLYGNLGGAFQQQGTSFVINFFFGVVMNAAVSVGMTVANTVNAFASNVMLAFRPQIIKLYSQDDKIGMRNLTVMAIKMIMFIYSLVAVPVFLEVDNLLDIWLVEVPDHSSIVCRLFLISIFFEVIRYVIIINIHASGNVKLVSFFAGTLFISVPVLTYLAYYFGGQVEAAFVIIIFANMALCAVNVMLVKHYIHIGVWPYYGAIANVFVLSAISLLIAFYIRKFFVPDGYIHIITNSIISVIIVGSLFFMFCFDKQQRHYVINYLKTKLHIK